MTENNLKEVEEQNIGRLLVTFVSPGSVFFDFEMEGIVPLQMIVIGEYMMTLGKSKLLEDMAMIHKEMDRKQIEVARTGVDPGVLAKSILRK